MEATFGYTFPAIRGIQAGREYYISMCPLRLIPRIFSFDEEVLAPELRAQRVLNKARVPEIARYIVNNTEGYVFSAITASVDAEVSFEPLAEGKEGGKIGLLHVPMDAKFIINDGQHRRAAVEMALRERPELGDETIAVVFFLDVGLARCQQMFADLNRYAIRPSTSLGVLYDHRDEMALLVKQVVFQCRAFKGLVEFEKSTLAQRSRKLFTLSAIYAATKTLLNGQRDLSLNEGANLAVDFWEAVARNIPDWGAVRRGRMSSGEVRRRYIHSHGIVLQALCRAGSSMLMQIESEWRKKLQGLREVDWSRSNGLWEGRAIIGGRVSKAAQNVVLTGNVIKGVLGISLSPEDERAEAAFLRGEHGGG